MLWSVNIGTVAGTVIRLHVTFLLFLGWIFLANWYSGGAQAAWATLARRPAGENLQGCTTTRRGPAPWRCSGNARGWPTPRAT